jgi:ferrous iron transport protein B
VTDRADVGTHGFHHEGDRRNPAPATIPLVAFVGAPNVGKSTLFNACTGSRRDTGNWPGTTVAVGRGTWRLPTRSVEAIDLPGAYGLDPLSPDEALTQALLHDAAPRDRPACTVVVLDATALPRSLYLLAQLRELPQRIAVAVTMVDVAARRGITVDTGSLGAATGTPVVTVDPRRRDSAAALAALVETAMAAPVPAARDLAWDLDDGADSLAVADERFAWIDSVVTGSVRPHRESPRATRSDRIDRITTSPIWGPPVFLAIMWMVFQLTTTVARPVQDLFAALLTGPVTTGSAAALDRLGLAGTPISGFLLDGLLGGVGMLLTFVPLMAIMFTVLAVLEDSGYMARAAVVTDRLMRALGLPGRAFLPLIVGFGCNVPGIVATRVLPDARHRLLTSLLVPFTSCSARLAVYVMIASIFFPDHTGTVVFTMYVLSLVFVVAVGLLLRGTLLRAFPAEPLVLDLPPYHVPVPRLVGQVAWGRIRGFLRTAGGIIVGTVAVVWLLQAIPAGSTSPGGTGTDGVDGSVFGAMSRAAAPVFTPAGFGEWHATGALITGFVAKEAVISSWSQTYAAQVDGTEGEIIGPDELTPAVHADFVASSGGHPRAAAWAFLVFLLAYTPCVATLATQRREIGLRWTAFGMGMQLIVAWTAAVAVFQIGSRL